MKPKLDNYFIHGAMVLIVPVWRQIMQRPIYEISAGCRPIGTQEKSYGTRKNLAGTIKPYIPHQKWSPPLISINFYVTLAFLVTLAHLSCLCICFSKYHNIYCNKNKQRQGKWARGSCPSALSIPCKECWRCVGVCVYVCVYGCVCVCVYVSVNIFGCGVLEIWWVYGESHAIANKWIKIPR